jgi:hypothetical protein
MSPSTDVRQLVRRPAVPPLSALPDELIVALLCFLSVRDVLRFTQASRACDRECREGPFASALWRHLIKQVAWPTPCGWAAKSAFSLDALQGLMGIPRPTHGWFFSPQFTMDEYGEAALAIELHSDLEWSGAFVRLRRGCCFTTLGLQPTDGAITLTAWLKASSECNLACKCGERTCVNYFVDYEADGAWHFLAMVERQTSSDWYMDGRFVYTFFNEGFLDKWREKGQLAIGRGTGTPSERSFQFDGCLSQICLWDRALSPEHIARLYEYGIPRRTFSASLPQPNP